MVCLFNDFAASLECVEIQNVLCAAPGMLAWPPALKKY